jgi:hypothetical protein
MRDWPTEGEVRKGGARPRDAVRDGGWGARAAHPVHGEALHSGEEVEPVMRGAGEVGRARRDQGEEVCVTQPREQGSGDRGDGEKKPTEALERELAPRGDSTWGKTVHEDSQLPSRPRGVGAISPSSTRHHLNPARAQVRQQGLANLGGDATLELGRGMQRA